VATDEIKIAKDFFVIAADNVFGEISTALKAGISDSQKLIELLAAVEEMKRERGRSGFVQAYQKFVGLAADHIGLIRKAECESGRFGNRISCAE
jgi:hypothetical protein